MDTLSLSPIVDNMIVIPRRTKNRMSFPLEEPIRIGWVNGLMNWSMPLRKYSDPPKMINSIPKGIYLFNFRFIRLSPIKNKCLRIFFNFFIKYLFIS